MLQKKIATYATKTDIIYIPKTDHKGVTLCITGYAGGKRGPGFWKHNNTLLECPNYVKDMKNLINTCWLENNQIQDTRIRYDWLKYTIQQFSIKRAKQEAKQRRQELLNNQNRLLKLEEKQTTNQITPAERFDLEMCKLNIDTINSYITRGERIRSRLQEIEHDEKSTAYFFNTAKANFQKKTITSLKDANGRITNDQTQINEVILQYYTELYSSRKNQESNNYSSNISTYLRSPLLKDLKQIEDDVKRESDKELSLNDLTEALKDMKPGKSPGVDGLGPEFYRCFWDELGPKLLETLNYSIQNGELPMSLRRAAITLLQKENKDPLLVKSYRPVSLLNCDYKILSKATAKRITPLLQNLININQAGCLKGRYIGQNIRIVEDLLDLTDEQYMPAILLQLDFEKAFDSIEWDFLFEVLKKFNIGEFVIKIIKLCYTNIFSTVLNNGYSTAWFRLFRGVRQGCPLSAALFIMCVEVLAEIIRANTGIKGVQLEGKELKLSQFADDTTCFVTNEASVAELFATIEIFTKHSGLKLNKEKTQLIWLGSWKTRTDTIANLELKQESFNMLGITLGYNKQACQQKNFDAKIEKMSKQMQIWKQRDLSMLGKILVCKAHGMSNLIYSLSNQVTHIETIKRAQGIIARFVWNEKPPKVKHTALVAQIDKGGLKYPDIEMYDHALKLSWLKYITANAHWNIIMDSHIEKYGDWNLVLKCNMNIKHFKLPFFYVNILKIFRTHFVQEQADYLLWNNKMVKINNNPIMFNKWYKKGMICFSDVLDEHNNFLPFLSLKENYDNECTLQVYCRFKKAVLRGYNAYYRKMSEYPRRHINMQHIKSTVYKTKNNSFIDISKAKCCNYYWEIIETKTQAPTVLPKWNAAGVTDEQFNQSLVLAKKSCREAKLVSFQFKVIHNIVANRVNLFRWSISNSDKCLECGAVDTTWHMFCSCPESVTAIRKIFKVLHISYFDAVQFLCGDYDPATNLIFLIIKWHIWKSRFYEEFLNIKSILTRIQHHIKLDKRLLSEAKFTQKWSSYEFLVT